MFTEERIAEVSPTITAIAHKYAWSAGLDADDLTQEQWLALLEREATDATFTEQKPAFITGKAGFVARTIARDIRTYNGRMGEEIIFSDCTSNFELISGDDSPEYAYELRELLETFEPKLRETAKLLMQGCSQSDIAAIIDLSRAAVCLRVKKIAVELSELQE